MVPFLVALKSDFYKTTAKHQNEIKDIGNYITMRPDKLASRVITELIICEREGGKAS